MTEFKTEIEKIIDNHNERIRNGDYCDSREIATDKLIQLFNKHIEDKKYSIITEVCNYQSDRLTTGLEPIEIAQDIINILKIKEGE